ncbi:MAG: hypothetical protein DHS20C06_18870 [Hyphobacterium sp.]|nr:MAG: hypothetical protein DHS20C06_18870 [Hyphobacterium sp.]
MGFSRLQQVFWQMYWPESRADDVLRTARERLLVALSLSTGILGVIAAAISFDTSIESHPVQTMIGVVGPLMCLAAPPALYFSGRLRLIASLVVTHLFILVAIPALSLGGAANPVILYLAGLPVLATFLIGYRAGLVSAVAIVSTLAALLWFREALPGLPNGFNEAMAAQWNTITLSFLVISIALFAAVFQREMGKANTHLNKARLAATAGNAAKSQFLANMSHEIRTPLNGILGMAALMKKSDLTEAQIGQAEIIEKSGEMLLTLLNDILDMSKIEAGEVQIEKIEFDLGDVIETVMSLHGLTAEAKGLRVATDIPEQAYGTFIGDPLRVSQILNNLMSNAVKFTSSGRIRFSVTVSNASVEFIVKDSGIGIEPEKLDRLFEPFTQADASTTRLHGGTGLGLSISRQLCKIMGGELSATSTPGEGSIFAATLPLRQKTSAQRHLAA